uniref:GSK3-beta interaction protein n=1 Tax=Anopheles coluzzii TaxID=1518534 RepID=UPI0020FFB7CE|nr:GSK3-beta interaction protein [Anopheles coluzzii]
MKKKIKTLTKIVQQSDMNDSVAKYYNYGDANIIDWAQEAESVIRDIAEHVKEASHSKLLPATRTEAYINITTLGDKMMCVKLNAEGLQIVGNVHDDKTRDSSINTRYETPYALLSDVCSSYVNSFGSSLVNALTALEQEHSQHRELEDVE